MVPVLILVLRKIFYSSSFSSCSRTGTQIKIAILLELKFILVLVLRTGTTLHEWTLEINSKSLIPRFWQEIINKSLIRTFAKVGIKTFIIKNL